MRQVQTERQTQEKEIVVTNLSSEEVKPRQGGRQFTPFNNYKIQGNDGITYETTDREVFKKASIGQPFKFKFYVETKSVNGRIYTHYRIPTPPRENAVLEKLKSDMIAELDRMLKENQEELKKFIREEVLGIQELKEPSKSLADMIDDEGDNLEDIIPFP